MASINDLDPETLRQIFRHLDARKCAQLSTCHKQWQRVLADDVLWRDLSRKDFLLTEASSPVGQPQDSWKHAYVAWHSCFSKYASAGKRAIAAWHAIETWTAAHHPAIRQSLRPPVTEAQLDDAEQKLQCKIPAAMRALYLCHDGQKLECDDAFPELTPHGSMFHGLFGGYSFYDHVACTRLLPLESVVWASLNARKTQHLADGLVVASAVLVKKSFVLTGDGRQLKVSSAGVVESWDAVPPGGDDTLLTWFEAYAEALQQQRFGVSGIVAGLPHIKGINMFPIREPWQRSAVTRGVKVQTASVFVPEMSHQHTAQGTGYSFFSYCVTFSLSPVEEQKEVWPATAGPFRPLMCVQLKSRHWIIRHADGEILQEVKGEGVIGEYPILTPGSEPYQYQSCTHQHDTKGSMEGSFTFVEGTISSPAGAFFDVECPRFMLERPEAIF